MEFQIAPIEHENNLKMEFKHVSAKKEVVCPVERSMGLPGRLKIEYKLERSMNKCMKLEETLNRVMEEKKESFNREKRAVEDRDRTFADNMKLTIENNKLVCDLNEKDNELKRKKLEIERLTAAHEENRKSFDQMMVKMNREVEDLREEKLSALKMLGDLKGETCLTNKTISELREKVNELKLKNSANERLAGANEEKCKSLDEMVVKMRQEMEELGVEKSGALRTVEQLRGEILEANRTIDDLKLKKLESNKMVELYKRRLENLWPKIEEIKEDLVGMVTTKAGTVADLVSGVAKLANWEEGEKLKFHDSKGKTGSSGNGSSRSCGSVKRGPHASNSLLLTGGGHFGKIAQPPLADRNVIEIIDLDKDDDGTKPNGSSNETNPEQGSSCSKRRRSDFMEDLVSSWTNKWNKNTNTDHEKNVSAFKSSCDPKCDSQTPHKKSGLGDNEGSSGSDGSCTDSKMEAFVESVQVVLGSTGKSAGTEDGQPHADLLPLQRVGDEIDIQIREALRSGDVELAATVNVISRDLFRRSHEESRRISNSKRERVSGLMFDGELKRAYMAEIN
ncbi:Unknown protein [Striga hermonthica]|uniref:Uncharacterized protein n=1 Tax=Striga hermonthica TaxID=68872 RepID=A0A9N7NMM1_STRHE|nr:Unknown protein [Striga hermonthica]